MATDRWHNEHQVIGTIKTGGGNVEVPLPCVVELLGADVGLDWGGDWTEDGVRASVGTTTLMIAIDPPPETPQDRAHWYMGRRDIVFKGDLVRVYIVTINPERTHLKTLGEEEVAESLRTYPLIPIEGQGK
jgi:hypothetical protein